MITVKDMRTSLGIECGRALGVVARLVVAQAAGGVAKHHGNVVADFKGEAAARADELAALAVALQKPALADRTDDHVVEFGGHCSQYPFRKGLKPTFYRSWWGGNHNKNASNRIRGCGRRFSWLAESRSVPACGVAGALVDQVDQVGVELDFKTDDPDALVACERRIVALPVRSKHLSD